MRTKKGVISAAKMQGTVTVIVDRAIFHPVYKKAFKRSKKFLADTGDFADLAAGDTVVISECRPLSKNKYFRITEVVTRVPRVSDFADEAGVTKETHADPKDDSESAS